MSLNKKYTSIFASGPIRCIVGKEKDEFLAKASLENLKPFLPDIPKENIDLLSVCFDAAVVGRINRNGDVIGTETALATYKNFIHKYLNIEHSRSKLVGTIVCAGFTEFGTGKPITPEKAKDMDAPFNITLGGVLWRLVSEDVTDAIEEASDPSSDKYGMFSCSWELGFTDYKIAVLKAGQKNLKDARIITDASEIENVKPYLKALGGEGAKDEEFYYRMPSEDVLPLGIGITEKPAAEVKGIATEETMKGKDPINTNKTAPKGSGGDTAYQGNIDTGLNPKNGGESMPNPSTPGKENQNNIKKISQTSNSNVNQDSKKNMKLTSVTDITDETLKQCSASEVSDLFYNEIKKGSGVWEKEKTKLADELKDATASLTEMKEKYSKMEKQVQSLAAEKVEREKLEKFNERMEVLNDGYDLTDEVRAALVEDVKAIASDEDFSKFQKKTSILLGGFKKKTKKDDDDGDDDGDDDDDKMKKKSKAKSIRDDDKEGEDAAKAKKKETGHDEEMAAKKAKADDMEDGMAKKKAKASEAIAKILDDAIENGEKDKSGLTNNSDASAATMSLKEKFKTAFAKENFVIKA